MTSDHQIELILTMVFFSIVVLFVALALGCAVAVLIRENRRLAALGDINGRLSAYHSALVNLRKEHVALDELVSSWMNRSATRAKRARRAEREEGEETASMVEGEPGTLFFPSVSNE